MRVHRLTPLTTTGNVAYRSQVDGYLNDLATAVEELGRLRWTLRQVIALADDAPALTDERLADRLVAMANPCSRPG